MQESKDSKKNILAEISERLGRLSAEEMAEKQKIIDQNLLEFANFREAALSMLYLKKGGELDTENVIRICLSVGKPVVLPAFAESKKGPVLYQVNDLDRDLIKRRGEFREPHPDRCKKIPLEDIDIAIIPGLAFDEKGGRIGFGDGYFNRLITRLPETTRKVAIAYEEQVVEHVPMDSRKYNLDIIITDTRTIYKI